MSIAQDQADRFFRRYALKEVADHTEQHGLTRLEFYRKGLALAGDVEMVRDFSCMILLDDAFQGSVSSITKTSEYIHRDSTGMDSPTISYQNIAITSMSLDFSDDADVVAFKMKYL